MTRKVNKFLSCGKILVRKSFGQVFTWSEGVLHNATWIPNASRVLDPTQWPFHFERLDVSTI